MKICYRCKRELPLTEFHKNRHREDGYQSYCKECAKIRNAAYYRQTKQLPSRVRQRERYRNGTQELLLEILRAAVCMDCGTRDHRVFEFDHRDPSDKIASVAALAKRGARRAMLDEISKCDIVCANCHRIRTYTAIGSYRLREQNLCQES